MDKLTVIINDRSIKTILFIIFPNNFFTNYIFISKCYRQFCVYDLNQMSFLSTAIKRAPLINVARRKIALFA